MGSPTRTPDIRYSDVARYVGLSLMKDGQRPKSQIKLHPLKAQEMAALKAPTAALTISGSPKEEEQIDKIKVHLSWLKAQHRAEKEEVRRLENCLSDSMLLEKKAQRRALRDREKFEFHQNHAAQVEDQIHQLKEELQQRKAAQAKSPSPKKADASGLGEDRPGGAGTSLALEDAPAGGRSQTAPPETAVREKLAILEEDEPEVAEDSHMTLKEYFDAADQRRERERQKKTQRSQMSSTARSQADSSQRSPWHPRRQLTAEEIAQNHEEYRKTIRQMMIDKCGDDSDDRSLRAKKAFKKLDLNGSGNVSLQEFADGVARLGINWQEMTGMTRPRELFKIFDLDKDGVIVFNELFPEMEEKEQERVSTPEFWKRWVQRNRDLENTRGPKWQPGTPDAELELLFSTSDKHDSASELRKWMASTIHRLKNRGKSDARCREIVAAHLPRGTGPKDLEDVHTFSSAEVKLCKKTYNDEVNDPVRNIQKVVYDMREQRRQLHDSRQKLWTLTMEPVMRKQMEDDRKNVAAAVGLSLGGNGPSMSGGKEAEAPGQAKKSMKMIAQQCKMDEDTVEFLHREFTSHADKTDSILKKGFQRLLRSLCPGRTISDSDMNYWWEQVAKTMPPPQDARKAQACDFEHFAAWYATSEARTV